MDKNQDCILLFAYYDIHRTKTSMLSGQVTRSPSYQNCFEDFHKEGKQWKSQNWIKGTFPAYITKLHSVDVEHILQLHKMKPQSQPKGLHDQHEDRLQ